MGFYILKGLRCAYTHSASHASEKKHVCNSDTTQTLYDSGDNDNAKMLLKY